MGAADAEGVEPTATISDPNWTLVEETSAGFLFSYNPSVPIAASGGHDVHDRGWCLPVHADDPAIEPHRQHPGRSGRRNRHVQQLHDHNPAADLRPYTTTNELAAFSSIDLVLTYTIVGNPEGLGFFAEVATDGDLRDDNNYSGWLNLTRA